MKNGAIATFVNELPAIGRYTFSREEIEQKFEKSDAAIKLALNRLQKKGKVVSPRRGFYVVVPEQYMLTGAPPPVWFIDALMKDWQSEYYVGLLSAAELHGAAHHHPQEFQVICDTPHRAIHLARYRIHFFKKWNVQETPTEPRNTPTGQMKVSTAEATALDLVRYYESAGHYSNVATVLSELSEKMTGRSLVAAAKCGVELAVVQRLGFILDIVEKPKLADPLHDWLGSQSPRITSLRPDLDSESTELNKKWNLYINDQIEPEE
ncbi:MAG: type IV toxin-antitoxin system AbiEi family antitoxin [Candidatus Obscuribacterales bacterium]|nr:type IV toxin-antitoxin system AbiEi family antitoxin [Candidatus Obscuribacterales bacterium]